MKKSHVQLLVGFAVSALFLYLALRPVKLGDLWGAIASCRWIWSFPFVAVTMLTMYIRAMRWRHLMKPTADLTSRRLFSPMMAGFAMNSLFPARAGEFARAYVLGKKESLPFTSVFATVVVERIFDSFMLLILLLIVFATLTFDPSVRYTYSTRSELTAQQLVFWVNVAACVLALLAVGMALLLRRRVRDYLLHHFEHHSARRGYAAVGLRVLRLVEHIGPPAWLDGLWILLLLGIVLGIWWAHHPQLGPPSTVKFGSDYEISGRMLKALSGKITIFMFLMLGGSFFLLWERGRGLVQLLVEKTPFAPRSVRLKINGLITGFSHGLASLRDFKTSLIVLGYSALVWVGTGWSLQIMAYGFPGMQMTLMQAIAITVITCIAIIIPAAPGYWGLMEIGIVFGMKILGVEQNDGRALAYSLVVHSLQYFPILATGLFCLWRERVSFGEITQGRESLK